MEPSSAVDGTVLDQLLADAWPPPVVERRGAWRYRWADGATRRANSALAVGGAAAVARLVGETEAFYRARGRAPVELADEVGDEWFGVYWSVEAGRRRHRGDASVYRRSLLVPDSPASFALARLGGVPAGVGQLVVEGSWAGVQCMASLPERRRRGVARATVHALAEQAQRLGADRLCLAVLADNVCARSFYERAGFSPSHEYCYFTGPDGR